MQLKDCTKKPNCFEKAKAGGLFFIFSFTKLSYENERFTLTTKFDMETNVTTTTKPQHDAKLPVVGSAFLVTVGTKAGVYRVIVIAKSEAECMNKVQSSFNDYEWMDVRDNFGKPLF